MKKSIVFIAILITAVNVAVAEDNERLRTFGDFRFRLERDWDSRKSSGAKRNDRSRARIRVRLGFEYELTPYWYVGIRARTGAPGSQQSPHMTIKDFNHNSTGNKDVNLDKWFIKTKQDGYWIWAGRNSFPFWKQNEMFWDDDVTPAGIAGSYKMDLDSGTLTLNGGYFTLPDGAWNFNGNLGAGQIVYNNVFGGIDFTAAAGLFSFDGEPGARYLRNSNGFRDYNIWVGNLQAKFPSVWNRPLTLGFDLMSNTKDYDSSEANRNETFGYVLSAKLGQLKNKGDCLLGYYYAFIEPLAVNASYAQDDWVRWGSANQTDSSDLKGHELRAAYAFSGNFNVVARLYLVEAVTSQQDGNRFRLDFNYKFKF